MNTLGIDPLQFGMILLVNLGLGLCTPPVGSCLFVGCAVGKLPMETAVRTIWPFYIAIFVALMLITFVPAIVDFAGVDWIRVGLGFACVAMCFVACGVKCCVKWYIAFSGSHFYFFTNHGRKVTKSIFADNQPGQTPWVPAAF